jgi:DNA-binding response OmpR family regulator
MRKVLVIEDEKEISDLLEIHLTDLNCEVTQADDGKVGLDHAINEQFDLIVLDIMLPTLDGIEICKEVRKREIYVPILMLTAKSEEFDKVLGLEIGADDYLTKPFSIREFIARVRAIFRRIDAVQKTDKDNSIINIGDLKIDSQKRRVILKGKRVELTQKEFDLLHLMASHPGRTYSREQLLNMIWGYQYNGYEHTVNSHINRLRTKIEDDLSSPKFIRTSWGVGYWFNDSIEE